MVHHDTDGLFFQEIPSGHTCPSIKVTLRNFKGVKKITGGPSAPALVLVGKSVILMPMVLGRGLPAHITHLQSQLMLKKESSVCPKSEYPRLFY